MTTDFAIAFEPERYVSKMFCVDDMVLCCRSANLWRTYMRIVKCMEHLELPVAIHLQLKTWLTLAWHDDDDAVVCPGICHYESAVHCDFSCWAEEGVGWGCLWSLVFWVPYLHIQQKSH